MERKFVQECDIICRESPELKVDSRGETDKELQLLWSCVGLSLLCVSVSTNLLFV